MNFIKKKGSIVEGQAALAKYPNMLGGAIVPRDKNQKGLFDFFKPRKPKTLAEVMFYL